MSEAFCGFGQWSLVYTLLVYGSTGFRNAAGYGFFMMQLAGSGFDNAGLRSRKV